MDREMADKHKLNDEDLELVVGGVRRLIDTGTSQDAAVREGAGKGFGQVGSLKNGTVVNTTGKVRNADGRKWAEIDYPVQGWIAASILGYH